MRKVKTGIIVSDKMNKTRVVEVRRTVLHPMYGKALRRRSRFMMHDEKNESHIGDVVKMTETSPLSSRKRWNLVDIVTKAPKVK